MDCFSNYKHELFFIASRERLNIVSGVARHSRHSSIDSEISDWASIISKEFRIVGPWCFQIKEDSLGRFQLLEVSTRIAGASGINRLRG